MKEELIVTKCLQCGGQFETEQTRIFNRLEPSHKFCVPCTAMLEERRERERIQQETETKRRELEQQQTVLARVIPPLYRETDRKQMDTKLLRLVDSFDLNDSKGLYVSGDVGKRKTRACALLLERYCRAGYSIEMVPSTRLAKHFSDQFSNDEDERTTSRERIKKCKLSHALLIDDIGKERATERFETELFSLIEFRTSSRRPTLYTSNLKINDLHNKLSAEGAGIIRRIAEFTHNFHVS